MIRGNQTIRPSPHRGVLRPAALAIAWCAVAACSAAREPAKSPSTTPSVSMFRVVPGRDLFVVPNPHSALSTVITFDARGFDSARVVYWSPGETPQATPFSRGRGR